MSDWTAVATDALLAGRGDWLSSGQLDALAEHPLGCVDTEYPHWARSVEGPEDPEPPAERHPAFYGCYDWHSAVHSHWCLVRQRRLFDDHPRSDEIVDAVGERLTPDRIAGEVEHLEGNRTFERPYGWAWLLRLAAELALSGDDRSAEWREALRPLEATVVELVREEFLTQARPIRVGTHHNTAYALAAVLDYARVVGAVDLAAEAAGTARGFFEDDEGWPLGYEPLGWDFVSPGLAEADLLRRVLDPEPFAGWLDGLLPGGAPALEPVTVEDDSGAALHLVGLNLTRAATLAGLAEALDGHRDPDPYRAAAIDHARAGLAEAFTDDYAGAHWLSSFVLYLLTRNAGGIAPA